MTVCEVLTQARDRLTPETWLPGFDALQLSGRFCVAQAITMPTPEVPELVFLAEWQTRQQALLLFAQVATGTRDIYRIGPWNDTHRFEDVTAALDAAIVIAQPRTVAAPRS